MGDEELEKSLLDCGCDGRTVAAFRECASSGDTGGELALLARHRRALLSRVHMEEQKISFLDYLVYRLEKGLDKREEGVEK